MARNPDPRGHQISIAPPVGATVRLLRDGRAGRVVAWSQGGLLCRVRLDVGATLECPGCELVPATEEARGPEPGGRGAAPRPVDAARPATILRLVVPAPPAASAAPQPQPDAGPAGRGRWEFRPIRARR